MAYCDQLLPNPFQNVDAFRGTTYFTAATISRYNLNRPFPQFTGDLLEQGRNGSAAWYNSAQVNYNQRVSGGLMLLTNYTFSKTTERQDFTDPFANIQQQGLYFNDRPHFLKFTAIYELPFGQNKKFFAGASNLALTLKARN